MVYDDRFRPVSGRRSIGRPETLDVSGWRKATCNIRRAARIVELQRVGYKKAKKRHRLEQLWYDYGASANTDKWAYGHDYAGTAPTSTARPRARIRPTSTTACIESDPSSFLPLQLPLRRQLHNQVGVDRQGPFGHCRVELQAAEPV